MAESYVTKFTKYVEEQRDNLVVQLKNKGLIPSANAPLGSLVSELENLQESFTSLKYKRDDNFPDFDDMFDNDPLRDVNGGQYKACAYLLISLGAENVLYCERFSASTNTSGYFYGEKVVISDGAEYENVKSALTHTMGENGIYTDSDGFKFGLMKIYATTPLNAGNGMYLQTTARELIDDYFIGTYWLYSWTTTTYNTYSLQYLRLVNSNIGGSTYGSYWNLPQSTTVNQYQYGVFARIKHIRIDNLSRFSNVPLMGLTSLEVLDFRGELLPKETETSWTLIIGATSTSGVRVKALDYIKLPSLSQIPLTVNIYWSTKYLYIPDGVSSCNIMWASGSPSLVPSFDLEKLHIGNGLTLGISSTQNYRFYPNLKDVTCSSNAFNKNEGAITVDFGYAPNLTKQSILNMFNNFADRTDKEANILKLAKYSEQYLTDEEKAILTNKNWTLTFV